MKRKYKFKDDEINVIIIALIEFRNRLVEEGRYTDFIDEIILKLSKTFG